MKESPKASQCLPPEVCNEDEFAVSLSLSGLCFGPISSYLKTIILLKFI